MEILRAGQTGNGKKTYYRETFRPSSLHARITYDHAPLCQFDSIKLKGEQPIMLRSLTEVYCRLVPAICPGLAIPWRGYPQSGDGRWCLTSLITAYEQAAKFFDLDGKFGPGTVLKQRYFRKYGTQSRGVLSEHLPQIRVLPEGTCGPFPNRVQYFPEDGIVCRASGSVKSELTGRIYPIQSARAISQYGSMRR